jgi:Rhodococcus equi virulence-associated protein
MSSTEVASKETIANDFSTKWEGKLDQEKIDAAVNKIQADVTSYPAQGALASMIFYVKCSVTVDSGKTFDGNAGGAFTPGGGALFGDVYTDDINKLYGNTVSFQLTATPVYVYVLFFDGNSNLLGHFQSGAVSTVTGVGGGTGSWS